MQNALLSRTHLLARFPLKSKYSKASVVRGNVSVFAFALEGVSTVETVEWTTNQYTDFC